MRKKRIRSGDAAEDGHPCEAALAFRSMIIRSEVAEEVPADVLDLAIQFAWIGKAVSRTRHLHDWFAMGIDPNTREMVAAMAVDDKTRKTALEHANNGLAMAGMEGSLRSIKRSKGFGHALFTVTSLCHNPKSSEIERLAILSDLASRLPDTKRLSPGLAKSVIVDFEHFRKMRKASA